jgi:cell division protein ZapA
MPQSIRVRILGREYPLIVKEGEEAITREIAAYVNEKMTAFKQAHPEQSDLVAAVFSALALAGELYNVWEEEEDTLHTLETALDALDRELADALTDRRPTASNGNVEASGE